MITNQRTSRGNNDDTCKIKYYAMIIRTLHCNTGYFYNHIGSVMVGVLASSTVFCGFESWSSQSKNYEISICCFSVKHTALRNKSKDWLVRNQDNVSEWSHLSSHRLL